MAQRVREDTKQGNIDYALMAAAILKLLARKRKYKEINNERPTE